MRILTPSVSALYRATREDSRSRQAIDTGIQSPGGRNRMIRSLVKQGIKRVLRMDVRPAEYGGPVRTPPAPEPMRAPDPPPPAPVAAAEAPVAEPPVVPAPVAEAEPKKPKKARAKKPAPVVEPVPVEAAAAPPTDDVAGPAFDAAAVQLILDEMVRPALQGDGGDITLLRIENNDIYVKLVGSCSTCPSSILTMKAGVEALLKEEFPSMNQLIQVE
jgi:Fe-S cluster biogenesis protein NfuA